MPCEKMFMFIGVEYGSVVPSVFAIRISGVVALGVTSVAALGVTGLAALLVLGNVAHGITSDFAFVLPGLVSLGSAISVTS